MLDSAKAPERKQFDELHAEDFQRHPVWINCHTADCSEPWYEDIDEETFRPYSGNLPVHGTDGILLLRAVIELKDGSRYPGFVTPGAALGTQQPQIFVGDRRFGFWGGVVGVDEALQQEFYAALDKDPSAIFPLRFIADTGLATGIVQGQVDGFYKKSRVGITAGFVSRVEGQPDGAPSEVGWLQMRAGRVVGYPQPERAAEYLKIVYANRCLRCGIFERQTAPFRFKPSVGTPSGFAQLHWVHDAFFVAPAVLDEITKTGITGLSRGPTINHDTDQECVDRVQLLIPTVIACAETSHLPRVTCRRGNEETTTVRAMLSNRKPLDQRHVLSPDMRERIRKNRETFADIPYCGRVKYHPPTSLALIPDHLASAPDVFQTAEWFGSGRSAFRITLASDRFVSLIREHRWEGLAFSTISQGNWSGRIMI